MALRLISADRPKGDLKLGTRTLLDWSVEVRISNDQFVGPGFLVVGTHARVNIAEEAADMRRIRTAHYARQRSIKATGNVTCSFYAIAEGHFEEQTTYPRSLSHNSP
jgi:hypothetical protein